MKRKNQAVVEAEITTSMRPIGPPPSIDTLRIVKIGDPLPPSAREIQNAIDVLLAAKARCAPVADEGDPGDAFLLYDVTLRVHGEEGFRIRGQRHMHRVLTEDQLPAAAETLDAEFLSLLRPLRGYALQLINDRTERCETRASNLKLDI